MAKKNIDPKKKTSPKYPPVDPKPNMSKGSSGPGAKLSRDKKGDIKATLPKGFAGITQETLRQDRITKAGTGSGTFSGSPAPRVGGKQAVIAKSPNLKSATKKVIKQSRKKPTGSPQARAAQKRNNKF